MKLLLITAISFVFACCSNSNTKSTEDGTIPSTVIAAGDSIHPLLTIGGCYSIKIQEDSFAGVILLKIEKEEEEVYYSFLFNGKIFDKVPTAAEFKNGGLWGRKIPTGYSANPILTFDNISIAEKDLSPVLNRFTLIETLPISKKNIEMIGSSGTLKAVDEFPQHIKLFYIQNERIKNEKSPHPQYPYEVVDWKNIVMADDPSDIPTPQVIWKLSKKTAHPNAAKLMQEDWFWDSSDDLSPFGNDDGSDAFYIFKDWRALNKEKEPALFLNELEESWGMSFAHKDMEGESELAKLEQQNQFYRDIDRSIIAVALGQIVLEGKISPKLKEYGIRATKRAMTPFGMKGMTTENMVEYKSRFDKILFILNQF